MDKFVAFSYSIISSTFVLRSFSAGGFIHHCRASLLVSRAGRFLISTKLCPDLVEGETILIFYSKMHIY